MLPVPHSGDSGRREVLFEEPPLPGPLSGDLGRRGGSVEGLWEATTVRAYELKGLDRRVLC